MVILPVELCLQIDAVYSAPLVPLPWVTPPFLEGVHPILGFW